MSENGIIHTSMIKNWVNHVLFKRGLFGRHIGTMSYIGSYPPPPPLRGDIKHYGRTEGRNLGQVKSAILFFWLKQIFYKPYIRIHSYTYNWYHSWQASIRQLQTRGSPGRVGQPVTCLVTDAKLTADPGVASSILAQSHTFVEIDHEIISTVILLPSAESFMKGCCQLQAKVCARLLVNCLFKLAQEKSVVRWTDRPAMTIAVDLGRKANKQTRHVGQWPRVGLEVKI